MYTAVFGIYGMDTNPARMQDKMKNTPRGGKYTRRQELCAIKKGYKILHRVKSFISPVIFSALRITTYETQPNRDSFYE